MEAALREDMRSGIRTWFLATLLVFVVGGCASSGSIEVKTAPTAVPNARSAAVHVKSSVPKSEETTREVEGAVVENLRTRKAFERVYSSLSRRGRPADLTVEATIVEFQGVSDLARGLGGAFAGRAVIVVDVVLTGSAGEVLGKATVEGKSSGGTAFAGTTMQAIQKIAEQIALFVVQK